VPNDPPTESTGSPAAPDTQSAAGSRDAALELLLRAFDPRRLGPGEVDGDPEQLAAALPLALARLVNARHGQFEHARELFLRRDGSGAAARVFARMDGMLAAAVPMDPADLCPDDEFAVLLDLAASADEGGDMDCAGAMYAALQALRPDQHQPFINQFNLVWQTLGVQVAADCYRLVSPMMSSPVFFYYAADCFESAGRREHAQLAIIAARELMDDPEYGCALDDDMAAGIRAFYRQIDADRLRREPPPPGSATFV
jgi:hypothetical protein